MADQPKLERCIGRLNDYWGGKMLSQVTASECRAYVKERGKTGGARADLETLRAEGKVAGTGVRSAWKLA